MSKTHNHYAYPFDIDIEAVMRFGSVKRWHMLDTVRIQTLAEHSGNVALLAFVVAVRAPGMFFGPAAQVAAAALLHDVDEVFTGDIPTPTKQYLSGLDKLESALTPPQLQWRTSDDIKILVKLCDIADGVRFIRQHGTGAIALHAMAGLVDQFDRWVSKGISVWPAEVLSHVVEKVWFYAHETGVEAAPGPQGQDGGPVVVDMARGQGNHAGGPGSVVRDASVRARDDGL